MDFLSVIKDAVIQPYVDALEEMRREDWWIRERNAERAPRQHGEVQRGVDERIRRNAQLQASIQRSRDVTNMILPRRDRLQQQINRTMGDYEA